MVQGQVFLKGEGGTDTFSRFIIFTFRNYVMHLKKKRFFCHHNFMKKGHSKLSKNEPENIPSIKITYL